MAKMLMLDGPLAGKVWDAPGDRVYPVRALDPADIAERGFDGEYRYVTYFPKTFMFGARPIIVGTCGSPDRRQLEEFVFAVLASDVAKEAAGPLPRFVCDHARLTSAARTAATTTASLASCSAALTPYLGTVLHRA